MSPVLKSTISLRVRACEITTVLCASCPALSLDTPSGRMAHDLSLLLSQICTPSFGRQSAGSRDQYGCVCVWGWGASEESRSSLESSKKLEFAQRSSKSLWGEEEEEKEEEEEEEDF